MARWLVAVVLAVAFVAGIVIGHNGRAYGGAHNGGIGFGSCVVELWNDKAGAGAFCGPDTGR